MRAARLLLCVYCRRIVEPPRAEGYRVASDDPGQCPSCGEVGLIDPRQPDTASALEAIDHRERLARIPASTRSIVRGSSVAGLVVGAAIGIAILLGLYSGVGSVRPEYAVLALVGGLLIIVPLGSVGIRAVWRLWVSSRALDRPARWAFALPAATVGEESSGRIACDSPLVAPLTGRPCVAYEIGVRRDEDSTAPPGTWLLLEQRCADASIDGHRIEGDRVWLDLPRQIQPFEDPHDEKLAHLMHQRGLSPEREQLHVYESVVAEDSEVFVRRSDNGVTVLRVPPPMMVYRE